MEGPKSSSKQQKERKKNSTKPIIQSLIVRMMNSAWCGVCACNPSTQKVEAEESEFETSLGYIVRTCFRKTKQNETKKEFT
jgi:hypothetical protein